MGGRVCRGVEQLADVSVAVVGIGEGCELRVKGGEFEIGGVRCGGKHAGQQPAHATCALRGAAKVDAPEVPRLWHLQPGCGKVILGDQVPAVVEVSGIR